MTHIALTQLTKRFDQTTVLHHLNLEIEPGEFMVVVGPSGCGKSTVLRLIAGLESPSEGDITFNGQSVINTSPKDRDVAMVFQNYALYPHMSVFDNLAFGLKMRKMPKAEIQARVEEAARILELTPLLQRKPKQLSGGQRQRVALGRAIVRQPKAFLMDEPLSNLDAKLRVGMRREICALHQRLGVTTLYVTHDQDEAMTMGQRIAILNGGILQQCAAPNIVYQQPENLFVAGFIGQLNTLNLVKSENADQHSVLTAYHSVEAPEITLSLPIHQQTLTLGFRPEDVTPSQEESPGITIPIAIQTIEYLGSHLRVAGQVSNHTLIGHWPANSKLTVGEVIPFYVPQARLHCFAENGDRIALFSES